MTGNIRYNPNEHGFRNYVGLKMPDPFGVAPSTQQTTQVMTDHWEKLKNGPVNAIFADVETALKEMIVYHSPSFNGEWGKRTTIKQVKNLNLSNKELAQHCVDILLHHFVTEQEMERFIKEFPKRKENPELQMKKRPESLLTKLFNKET